MPCVPPYLVHRCTHQHLGCKLRPSVPPCLTFHPSACKPSCLPQRLLSSLPLLRAGVHPAHEPASLCLPPLASQSCADFAHPSSAPPTSPLQCFLLCPRALSSCPTTPWLGPVLLGPKAISLGREHHGVTAGQVPVPPLPTPSLSINHPPFWQLTGWRSIGSFLHSLPSCLPAKLAPLPCLLWLQSSPASAFPFDSHASARLSGIRSFSY